MFLWAYWKISGHCASRLLSYMTLLLKAKWSSVCLLLQDLFCKCITLLRNIETGRNVSLGVLLLIWLPGSSISVQKDKSKHYSQCRGCFSNTLANEGLWLRASHLIIVNLRMYNNLSYRYIYRCFYMVCMLFYALIYIHTAAPYCKCKCKNGEANYCLHIFVFPIVNYVDISYGLRY